MLERRKKRKERKERTEKKEKKEKKEKMEERDERTVHHFFRRNLFNFYAPYRSSKPTFTTY